MNKVTENKTEKETFEKEEQASNWVEVFSDDCTDDWKKKWLLDGEIGKVNNSADGMTLTAGPEFKNDAHHMVLWTKDTFKGDLMIEYDYTRLDSENRCVNIIYIQATGSGEGVYAKDIMQWQNLRKVPAMKSYFNLMNTYHISYSVFPDPYIRGRRYMPHSSGLKGSDLDPDYFPENLFKIGEKHHIKIIKRDIDLFMSIESESKFYHCHFSNRDLPAITEGYVGLRHMFTRSAIYKNFKIYSA